MPTEKDMQPEADVYRLYEEALRLLFDKKFKEAEAILSKIRQDYPGDAELLARVNSYLKVCEKRLADSAAEPNPDSVGDLIDYGVFYHNRGEYPRALEFYNKAKAKAHGDTKAQIHYAMAATHAAQGDTSQALESLRTAIELREELRFMARQDPDFQSLTENSDFKDLVRPQKSEE